MPNNDAWRSLRKYTGIKSEIDQELDSDKPDASYIEELGRKLDLLQELERIERPEIKLAAMEILMSGRSNPVHD